VLPDILRPNVPEFNEPGGLCNEVDFLVRRCPDGSLVGSARVVTPVLPFELSGPVYIVQEMVDPLPRLFVLLRGGGFEVPLRARNFFQGIRVVNLFETVPDVPQSYFELNINGGPDGILNNFFDLCKASFRKFDATFTGQNGKIADADPLLEVRGCGSVRGASIRSRTVKVSKKGVARIKIACRRTDARCKGRVTLRRKGAKIASKKFSIASRKTRTVKLKLSKKGMKALRRAKRLRVRAVATVSGAGASSASLRLMAPKRR
jgi:hypothetical protein